MSEPFEEIIPESDAWHVCGCGCTRAEHDKVTGKCLYCFEDDCGGFEYDEEATVIAATEIEDLP